jgi:hypothetical protein
MTRGCIHRAVPARHEMRPLRAGDAVQAGDALPAMPPIRRQAPFRHFSSRSYPHTAAHHRVVRHVLMPARASASADARARCVRGWEIGLNPAATGPIWPARRMRDLSAQARRERRGMAATARLLPRKYNELSGSRAARERPITDDVDRPFSRASLLGLCGPWLCYLPQIRSGN